jgi:hypothetical protein
VGVAPEAEVREDEEDAEKGFYKEISAGDLGMRLPIGTGPLDGSKPRNTGLAFRDWSGSDDRVIGRRRAKEPAMTTADMVVVGLAHFVTRWGEHDFTTMKSAERELILAGAPSADIFHAWLMLRCENIGEEYGIKFPCGNCKQQIAFKMDLEDIVCKVPHDESSNLVRDFALKKGIQYKGERRRAPKVAPMRWGVYRKVGTSGRLDVGQMKLIVIEGSVVGFEGVKGEVRLPESSVDTMKKGEIERLASFINEDQPGPDLSIEVDCPGCDARNVRPVVWEYDVFFSV